MNDITSLNSAMASTGSATTNTGKEKQRKLV